MGFETYTICLKENMDDVLEGIRWLVNKRGVKVWFTIDLGEDNLVRGNEPLLGSCKTDMLALATLSKAIEDYRLKGFLAVGVLGLEGGGSQLDQRYLAEHLFNLYRSSTYEDYYIPPDNVKKKAIYTILSILKKKNLQCSHYIVTRLKGLQRERDMMYCISMI